MFLGLWKYLIKLLVLENFNVYAWQLEILLICHLFFKIPLPEKPDTEDEDKIKKWKGKVRNVKKENRERHSQRCDIELKLSVRPIHL